MAILDFIEVTITLPNHIPTEPPRALQETPLGTVSNDGVLSWAPSPKRSENYIPAPEGARFGICITLLPGFDFAHSGDGIHVTLRFDSGQEVDHYYSIKYDEMDRDPIGRPTKTIPSALRRYGDGYQAMLFEFGRTTIGSNGAPMGYYSGGSLPPQGSIVATIIPVRHVAAPTPAPMSMPQGQPVTQGNTAASTMNPVPLVNLPTIPIVDERVLRIQDSDSYVFVFRYRPSRLPISECFRAPGTNTGPGYGGSPGENLNLTMNPPPPPGPQRPGPPAGYTYYQ